MVAKAPGARAPTTGTSAPTPEQDIMGKKKQPAEKSPPGRKQTTPEQLAFQIEQGELIRTARHRWEQETGSKLADAMEAASVSYTMWYAYERGAVCPTTWVLAKIAVVLGTSPTELMPEMELV